MGILLPWRRENEVAEVKPPRQHRPGRAKRLAFLSLATISATLGIIVFSLRPAPSETLWQVAGGQIVSFRDDYALVKDNGAVAAINAQGNVSARAGDGAVLVLGEDGAFGFVPDDASEKVVAVLEDDLVLTQKGAEDGSFGEPWNLTAYRNDRPIWTVSLPGTVAAAYSSGGAIAISLTDLSAGGAPSVTLLNGSDGAIKWTRSLPEGYLRALGILKDGHVVVVLDSGVTAFLADGSESWTFTPKTSILAAAVADEMTCFCVKANQTPASIVYPFKVTALTSAGVPHWERGVREEPVRLQNWKGKEAVALLAENYIAGFRVGDGACIVAGRVEGTPVSAAEDRVLVRDRTGVRLIRLESLAPGV